MLIVLIPLILLGWMGIRILHDEQKLHDHQIQTLIGSQLYSVEKNIAKYFTDLEETLPKEAASFSKDADSVRSFLRIRPEVRQMLIFDHNFKRVFPPGNSPLTKMEREFLERAGAVLSRLESGDSKAKEKNISPDPAMSAGPSFQDTATEKLGDHRSQLQGWHVWYSGTEMNHLFWWSDENQRLIGFELDPISLQSSIIALLPSTGGPADRLGDARIRLVDSKGIAVYQWGQFTPEKGISPVHQLPLNPPLGTWKLEYFGSGFKAGVDLKKFNVIGILTAVGVALFGLAFFLYRENSREMKFAEQRVNFVNQVSHELKTPLTNIRLYAELLDENLPEQPEESGEDHRFRHYLDVITSESRRLSRLIANVLNFARSRKNRLTLRREMGNVDEIIQTTLNTFAPLLEAKGVRINFQPAAGDPVDVDLDALEQILNNIFSNMEKYGASGERLDIESHRKDDRTCITVQDYGPGIPKRDCDRIFQPFYRISSRTNDGVSGTGIGLGIARDLARLHGGDLTLLSSEKGACFRIELCTPVKKGEA
jgi:signal transduction histidine kinase